MSRTCSRSWRRDLLVGCLASLLTSVPAVSIVFASHHSGRQEVDAARREARAATALAEQRAAEADQQRALARRALVVQAADFAGFGLDAGAEVMQVTTDAVAPEIPRNGWLLLDKKASSWVVGDIVVFRQGTNNYLGRVIASHEAGDRLTVGRNGEKNREIRVADLLGRGVLNSR